MGAAASRRRRPTPAKEHGTTWPASPHTIAKIRILSGYLNAYIPILGRSRPGEDILIVDGFAGPGEYTNHAEGSPLVVLNRAKAAVDSAGPLWKARKVHLAFVEQHPERFENLQRKLSEQPTHPQVSVYVYNTTFEKGLAQLRAAVPRPFTQKDPLFVFIDPFGAKGAPFHVVEQLLQTQSSEVFINLDADGIARIVRAGGMGNEAVLSEIFGDESWRTALISSDFQEQCRQVRDLYVERLRSLPRVRYVYSFGMQTTERSLNYYLVFASQHYRGLEKMKEAMKVLGQDGSYQFSDDRYRTGQQSLFRFDDVDDYAPLMQKEFRGKSITYDTARDYALNYTPFINPKKLLQWLENQERIEVESTEPKRRRGTFPEEKIRRITFKDID